jgi:hypothetical protein
MSRLPYDEITRLLVKIAGCYNLILTFGLGGVVIRDCNIVVQSG